MTPTSLKSGAASRFSPTLVVSLSLSLSLSLVVLSFPLASRAMAEPDTSDARCLECHGAPVKRAGGPPLPAVSGEQMAASLHGKAHIACVDCHVDLADQDPRHHPQQIASVACASCHEGEPAKHGFHPQMAAKPDQVTCQECHGGHEMAATKDPAFKFSRANQTAACGACHEAMRDDFKDSAHGKAFAAGVAEAPGCLECHSAPFGASPKGASAIVLKQNQAKLCLSCHLDNAAVRARIAPSAGFIAAFERSVHGRALAAGDEKAPSCSNCHSSHAVKAGLDSTSLVSRINVADTCSECHAAVAKEFGASIHAAALKKGSVDAPTCTTCHGEHDILKHNDPRAPVSPGNVSQKVCAPCHGSLKLTRKYGIRSDRFETFEKSYHGLAMKGGDVEVANCASCHGVHDIRPSSDPGSSVHRSHLATTCGKCHPGADASFATGAVHVTMARGTDPLLYWLSTIYLILIVVVVGGMIGHNLLDFTKRARRRLALQRGDEVEAPVAHRLYVRMTLPERWQHGALALSFMVLAFTGFLLRYPEAGWVVWIKGAWTGLFRMRASMHRIASVVMLAAGAVHIGYVVFTARGRQLIRDLWPRRSDLSDAAGVVAYNLGLGTDKPKLGRFSYVEKVEYWALIWGTIVMATTGLIMWFDNSSMRAITKHGYDIARLIHFFEAWLATLSILCWHLYFVAFNPDSYPMSLTWLTGEISEREMHEEHPLELEQLKAAATAADAAPAAPAAAGARDDKGEHDNDRKHDDTSDGNKGKP